MRQRPSTLVPILAIAAGLTACVDQAPSQPPALSESPTVTIAETSFTPQHVTIQAGDAVTWVWDDGGTPHDVSGDGFQSEVQKDGRFSHTFEEEGSYPYVCTLHSGMRGTVTVVDS